MTDAFGGACDSSARRAARRQRLTCETEEAASGLPHSADCNSISRGASSEDQTDVATDPTRDPFQQFDGMETYQDHCKMQQKSFRGEGDNSSCYIDDVSFLGGDVEDDRKYCTLSNRPAPREIIDLFGVNTKDEEKFDPGDALGWFNATVGGFLKVIDFVPKFSASRKYSRYERQAARPLGAAKQEAQALQDKKKYEEKFDPNDASGRGWFYATAGGLLKSINFVPKFSASEKYNMYKRRVVKPLGATRPTDQGLQEFVDNALHPGGHDKKKHCWEFALLVSFAGIILAAALATGKIAGGVDLGFKVKNRKHHPPVEKNPTETSTFTTYDLSAYGYPYTQDTSSSGWVTWLPGKGYEGVDLNHVSFDASDGISSLKDCAAICQESKAPTASWSGRYNICWCSFVPVTNLCREPCVEDEYIDFATVPIDEIHYCKVSVCDKNWFLHVPEYCKVGVFDQDACDAKKEEIEGASTSSITHSRT